MTEETKTKVAAEGHGVAPTKIETNYLLEALLSDDPNRRIRSVADALFAIENYTKLFDQALYGLSCKLMDNNAVHRDAYAARAVLRDLAEMLRVNKDALYARLAQTTSRRLQVVPPAADPIVH